MKKIQLLTAIAALFLASCGTTPAPAPTAASTTVTPAPAAVPAAKMITVEAKLIEVEDAGYPIAYISIVANNSDAQESISFNQEIAPVFKIEELSKMLNKIVVVEYEETMRLEALDILSNGKSIIGNTGEVRAEAVKYTGTLSALAETKSDMPDEIELKTANGKTLKFEYFITPEMVAANGKTVDILAISMPRHDLKKISLK
jgi:hypothetical protein